MVHRARRIDLSNPTKTCDAQRVFEGKEAVEREILITGQRQETLRTLEDLVADGNILVSYKNVWQRGNAIFQPGEFHARRERIPDARRSSAIDYQPQGERERERDAYQRKIEKFAYAGSVLRSLAGLEMCKKFWAERTDSSPLCYLFLIYRTADKIA